MTKVLRPVSSSAGAPLISKKVRLREVMFGDDSGEEEDAEDELDEQTTGSSSRLLLASSSPSLMPSRDTSEKKGKGRGKELTGRSQLLLSDLSMTDATIDALLASSTSPNPESTSTSSSSLFTNRPDSEPSLSVSPPSPFASRYFQTPTPQKSALSSSSGSVPSVRRSSSKNISFRSTNLPSRRQTQTPPAGDRIRSASRSPSFLSEKQFSSPMSITSSPHIQLPLLTPPTDPNQQSSVPISPTPISFSSPNLDDALLAMTSQEDLQASNMMNYYPPVKPQRSFSYPQEAFLKALEGMEDPINLQSPILPSISTPDEKPKEEIKQPKPKGFLSLVKHELWNGLISQDDADFVDGLLSKQKEVYEFFRVPWMLERLLLFGFFLCLDAFLYIFTFMPIRIILALWKIPLLPFIKSCRISVGQREDMLRGIIIAICFTMLSQLDSSVIYHYIRAQATLKLYVIYNVLEVLDRLCSSFSYDIFETMNASLTHTLSIKLVFHACIALIYVCTHSLVLFGQVVTLNVAINSFNNALLTLLISNQFVELKGSVFKKFEKSNIFQLSCSDIVERFQIVIFLVIITLRNFSDLNWEFSSYWISQHAFVIGSVIFSECVVDWIKHCFVIKFNSLSSDCYSSFVSILVRDVVTARSNKSYFIDNAHRVARRIGFVPVPLACLVLRQMWGVIPQTANSTILFISSSVFLLLLLKILVRTCLLGISLKHIDDKNQEEVVAGRQDSSSNLLSVDRYKLTTKWIPS